MMEPLVKKSSAATKLPWKSYPASKKPAVSTTLKNALEASSRQGGADITEVNLNICCCDGKNKTNVALWLV